MGKNQNTNRDATRSQGAHKSGRNEQTSEAILNRVEIHRNGFALMPEMIDKKPGVAYFIANGTSRLKQRFCSCTVSNKRTCPHILALMDAYKLLNKGLGEKNFEEHFSATVWYRLASIMADDDPAKASAISMRSVPCDSGHNSSNPGKNSSSYLRIFSAAGEEMLSYYSTEADRIRFIERIGKIPEEDAVPSRGSVLDQLILFTLTDNERLMNDKGFKTRKQTREESFWHRLAYHGYREFGASGCSFHPAVEESTGTFTVTCNNLPEDSRTRPIFRMIIPRTKVSRLIQALKEFLPNQHDLAIHPIPLRSIFKVSADTQLDLEVHPIIELIQEDGEKTYLERQDLERFRYGDLIYVKELGLLAELEKPGELERKFKAPIKMVLKKSQVPSFLEDFGDALIEGDHLVDENVRSLKIFRKYDQVEIAPDAISRDWCWLSVKYGFGNAFISLNEILQAKEEGQRFINTDGGWVDCNSAEFDGLDAMVTQGMAKPNAPEFDNLPFSRMELFRFRAALPEDFQITGKEDSVNHFKGLLNLQPMQTLPELKGVTSTLRPYQRQGVEWIRFLYENGLGGLLCDDMGLGKTHEVMHFLVGLQEQESAKGPFLVVCPTTVLGHWKTKIREHAPVLEPVIYHGNQRDLAEAADQGVVFITSYGILRNDIEELKDISFPVAVFDEIQNIKNPQTLAYASAKEIRAGMKLGLTGTPIENNLTEIKALLDLTLPGYLGPDKDFDTRYIKPIELNSDRIKQQELSRLILPFTLRRKKDTVLDDLPEKIEDIRTCELSEDQIKLYRDAISSRANGLIKALNNKEETVPYIHIFALLTLLKQICNHPLTVKGATEAYEQYESGKWELFKELLTECLDSGQKVVVYSQFVGMIQIMEKFLQAQGVDFVTLTGASRNREKIISRFNDDPACRVFVGSLKAGGVGIDLVAASVVIHYDRWWNAAREDQATDRVHRIGQRRGVQVFKLVTEGTLEEKISAIIEKKRDLMETIVKENDPSLLKVLSREQLIELLAAP